MNGVHDMGGMHGMGAIIEEKNEPVFHIAIVYRVVDQANPYSEAKADRKSPPSRLP